MAAFIPNWRCIVLSDKNYFLDVKNAAAFQLRQKWVATVLWEMAPAAIPTFCGLLREKNFNIFFKLWIQFWTKFGWKKFLWVLLGKNLNLSQKKCFLSLKTLTKIILPWANWLPAKYFDRRKLSFPKKRSTLVLETNIS